MLTASEIVDWAASSWTAEVKNGQLQNVHRRALDTKWRQLIRHFGGDDGERFALVLSNGYAGVE